MTGIRKNANLAVEAVPKTKVILYREIDGSAPFVEWFATLPAKAQDRCFRFEGSNVLDLNLEDYH